MKKLFLFCATVTFSTSVFAYPITPRPLRKLIIESEYILHGKVLSLGTLPRDKKNEFSWGRDFAVIRLIEMLQGETSSDTIKVYYTAGMLCPAPPFFIKNSEVIAFVSKDKKIKNGYIVPALSYGVKSALEQDGITIYKARIREMQQILAITNTQEKEERTIDWLVSCVENKATRWEGTYELSPGSDFMSYYDREEPVRKEIYLTSVQRKKLFIILLQTDTLEYSDVALTDIVLGVDDTKLLALLKKSLPKVDEDYLWPAGEIMKRIVNLTCNDELEKLYKQFSEYSYWDEKEKDDRKKVFHLFIRKMENVELRSLVSANGISDS